MQLSEIFDDLSYLDLNQLGIGGDLEGGIQSENFPKVISAINLAANSLYSKFPLRKVQIAIQQYDHITSYILDRKYAFSNDESTETYKYIIDSPYEPFNNDVIYVDKVFNEIGEELPLNDNDFYYSIFTPKYNVVQVPYPDAENALYVEYRATPVKIETDNTDLTVNVEIPEHLREAMLFYVAHKLYAPIDPNLSVGYFNKYTEFCNQVDYYGLVNRDMNTNLKLERNGWV